jgi:hypothetical protein
VSQSGSVDQRAANQSGVSMARDQLNSPISSQGNHETPLVEGGRGAVKGDQLRGRGSQSPAGLLRLLVM